MRRLHAGLRSLLQSRSSRRGGGAGLASRPRADSVTEIAYVAALLLGCLLWVVTQSAALHYGRRLAREGLLRAVSLAAGAAMRIR